MKKKVCLMLAGLFIFANIGFANPAPNDANRLKINGDVRFRFDYVQAESTTDNYYYKYRVRLNADYQINDKLNTHIRAVMGEREFNADKNNVSIDNWYFSYRHPQFNATLGRQDFKVFTGLGINLTDSGTIAAKVGTKDQYYAHLDGFKLEGNVRGIDSTLFIGTVNDKGGDAGIPAKKEIQGVVLQKKLGAVDVGVASIGILRDWSYQNALHGYIGAKIGAVELYNEYVRTNWGSWLNKDTHNAAFKYGVSVGELKNTGDTKYSVEYRKVGYNALNYKFTDAYRNFGANDYSGVKLEASHRIDANITGTVQVDEVKVKNDDTKNDRTVRMEFTILF